MNVFKYLLSCLLMALFAVGKNGSAGIRWSQRRTGKFALL